MFEYDIRDIVGEKNRGIIDVLARINSKMKALVLASDEDTYSNNEVVENFSNCIPFTSIEKARNYCFEELSNLGMCGIIVKIND